jgi:hypothetical protein
MYGGQTGERREPPAAIRADGHPALPVRDNRNGINPSIVPKIVVVVEQIFRLFNQLVALVIGIKV